MRLLPLLAMALAAACGPVAPPSAASPPSVPSAAPLPLRLVGTEPFWGAEVTADQIRLSGVDRPTLTAKIDWKRSMMRPRGSAFIAEGTPGSGVSDMGVVIEPGPCSDGMSDRVYPYKAYAQVTRVRGEPPETFDGCAGPESLFRSGA